MQARHSKRHLLSSRSHSSYFCWHRIEIKLKNYGYDSFEVSDNGSGVKREDFDVLVRKHHTSKIKTFSDLQGVASFGFRGEALSSLAELCGEGRLVILTRAKEEAPASRLTFKANGEVLTKEDHHRKQGTSVLAEGLFEPLPVRRVSLAFNRLELVLWAWCCVSRRISSGI